MSDESPEIVAADAPETTADAGTEAEAPSANDVDSGYEAAFDKIAGVEHGAESSGTAAESEGTTPAAGKPGAEAGTTPAAVTTEDAELLQRFQLDASDLPANPERRAAFIENLRTRHNDQAQMWRELEGYRKASPQAPAGQQQAAAPLDVDESWKAVEEAVGDPVIAAALRSAHEAVIHQTHAPVQQQIQQAMQAAETAQTMLEQLHYEQGISKVQAILGEEFPLDETKTEGKRNLERLKTEAAKLLRANYDPRKYTVREALQNAASIAFSNEIKLAERKKAARQHRAMVNGGVDAGGRSARTQRFTVDDAYDTALDGLSKGMSPKRIAQQLR
jgi:hypothetical protein